MSSVAYAVLWLLTRAIARLVFRYRVDGEVPLTGGVLVAANHASYLDIPLLGCGMRRRAWYLGRSDLFPVPIVNGMLRSLGWIPLRLGRLDREAFGKAISLIQAGKVVVIFPEGGRSHDGHLRQPKAGIGVIVSQTGCPVVPAYIKGTFEVLPTGARWPRFRQVTVRFGAPLTFQTGGHKETVESKRFYEQVSRTVIEQIAALGNVPLPKGHHEAAQETPNRTAAGTRKAE
ncbi:lysophospholipid acyltransferase family protein [Nitrospira moscoviensis]|uniref:Putative Acyltransferase n=1 Tax=Nitrospira moscoviensis TaxID=42253 RepID=A0A0K2G7E9_NITMO|nr:lysophospholipid acyltransferase family protein [Nitrospira moscoviensis]ALA56794.1 putative Acyltransferase [Nitrospira moscoviensis]